MPPALTVLIPMYNEQEVLPLLISRLRPVLDDLPYTYEVLAVDDGSNDSTPALVQRFRREWSELRLVRLRTNAGHQAAISAGLTLAEGDYVVTLDADLQDPPEVIPQMMQVALSKQVDVVYGVRNDRSTDSTFKRVSARLFYRLIRLISSTSADSDAGDYRLMSRATVDAVNTMPDHHRVLRFIVPALGFPSARVEYRRETRAAGNSKYPFLKMLRLSLDSVTGFSVAPLRAATVAGISTAGVAMLLLCYIVVSWAIGSTVPGWTSTVSAIAAFSAVQLLSLGVLGEYVGRVYTHLQARPTFFIAYDSNDPPTATERE